MRGLVQVRSHFELENRKPDYIIKVKAKIHFWSLYFGPILILIPILILLLNVVPKNIKSILFWLLSSIH